MEPIKFYRSDGKYGCFSNFSRDTVFLKGHRWRTSEHYFQAQKFAGHPDEDEIRYAHKPMKAAQMGRERSRPLRPDWEDVKDNIMREVVMAKFSQNKKLQSILLGTEDRMLIEHTANDRYWGDGGDGSGENKLGIILMEVRQAIRENKKEFRSGQYQ